VAVAIRLDNRQSARNLGAQQGLENGDIAGDGGPVLPPPGPVGGMEAINRWGGRAWLSGIEVEVPNRTVGRTRDQNVIEPLAWPIGRTGTHFMGRAPEPGSAFYGLLRSRSTSPAGAAPLVMCLKEKPKD